ncbi:MAG: hypothetical protein Q4C47_05805, partial [Planctomycetia bacterium]|nr:hypothetical protein [Planctomycetia bacterium]
MESLEDRRLLSISAAEYELLRTTYTDFDLPEEMSTLVTTDLGADELTRENLQSALDRAATTPQTDLILLRAGEPGDCLDLNDTSLVVNVDSSRYGDVVIVSLPDQPVNVLACNGGESSFRTDSGNLRLGGIHLTGIDMSDITNLESQFVVTSSPGITAETATLDSMNVCLYDTDGNDVTDLDTYTLNVTKMVNEINAAVADTGNSTVTGGEGVDGETGLTVYDGNSVTDDTAENYVVIFVGGYNASYNRLYYYLEMVRLYNICVTQYDIPTENIWLLYADGTGTGADTKPYRNSAVYENSDMSFASGSTVLAATAANMSTVFTTLSTKMTGDDHLLFWSYDHGSGVSGETTNRNDYVCAWNNTLISGATVASYLSRITTGYVTTVHAQCYSGGILDNIQNEQTGEVLASQVNGAWYGMAATNHYEQSWTTCNTDSSGRYTKVRTDFTKSFIDAIDKVNGAGLTSTSEIFSYAMNDCGFVASGEWSNNGGAYAGNYSATIHPWAVGSEFSLFTDGTGDDYNLVVSDGGSLSSDNVIVGD